MNGQLEDFERLLSDGSKQITSFLIPPIDFFIPEEHITPTLLAPVDSIGIARGITPVAFNTSKSTKPANLWNVESSKVGPLLP